MILNAFEGKPLPVYGDGSNVRDWLFVEDHARALYLILKNGLSGETYNVGGRNERTNLQVVEGICTALDELSPNGWPHDRHITYVTDRPGHDYRYAIDASKLEGELGWRAEKTFTGGLAKTVQWSMLTLAESQDEVRVVADQLGSPTYVPDIAVAIVGIVQNVLRNRSDPLLRRYLSSCRERRDELGWLRLSDLRLSSGKGYAQTGTNSNRFCGLPNACASTGKFAAQLCQARSRSRN